METLHSKTRTSKQALDILFVYIQLGLLDEFSYRIPFTMNLPGDVTEISCSRRNLTVYIRSLYIAIGFSKIPAILRKMTKKTLDIL